jgi:cyclopropane-fatty-acyl-phospholipid synthase
MTNLQTPTTPTDVPSPDYQRAVFLSRAILLELFGPRAERTFTVRFWDGSSDVPSGPSQFTIVLQRPGALRRMLLPPSELSLGEAYLRGDFDLGGSIEAAASLGQEAAQYLQSPLRFARLLQRLLQLPKDDVQPGPADPRRPGAQLRGKLHSRERDAAAVRFHYDVGNDFYSLWLDQRLVYSCAYFRREDDDLDTAQKAKLEHICRKLRLKPGERLLDIGCGWGGLVQYAAARYGVQALGITLSEPQAALARQRIIAAGLSDRCRIEVQDYRALDSSAPFDKVVSVGMFEHVGVSKLSEYFAAAYRLTRPGGLFLNHGIAGPASTALAPRPSWLGRKANSLGSFNQRYVFPDGDLVSPATAIQRAEAVGFETHDVENLRQHYALTLRHWVRRLEASHNRARDLVGESTYRVWRLYMSGSAAGFASGKLSLIQALFSRPGPDGPAELPLTRADLYEPTWT